MGSFDAGFFSKVEYNTPELQDNSWTSKCENIADVLRAPRRWLAGDCFGAGKTFIVIKEGLGFDDQHSKEVKVFQKIIRDVIAIVTFIFGELFALPFMAVAFLNKEIRLKHAIAVRNLTEEEKKELQDLINQRLELAKDKQGCEPVTGLGLSFLCSITCLLCCVVCRKH